MSGYRVAAVWNFNDRYRFHRWGFEPNILSISVLLSEYGQYWWAGRLGGMIVTGAHWDKWVPINHKQPDECWEHVRVELCEGLLGPPHVGIIPKNSIKILNLKNNDGREWCFWCGHPTKKVLGFSSCYNVCSRCKK